MYPRKGPLFNRGPCPGALVWQKVSADAPFDNILTYAKSIAIKVKTGKRGAEKQEEQKKQEEQAARAAAAKTTHQWPPHHHTRQRRRYRIRPSHTRPITYHEPAPVPTIATPAPSSSPETGGGKPILPLKEGNSCHSTRMYGPLPVRNRS